MCEGGWNGFENSFDPRSQIMSLSSCFHFWVLLAPSFWSFQTRVAFRVATTKERQPLFPDVHMAVSSGLMLMYSNCQFLNQSLGPGR